LGTIIILFCDFNNQITVPNNKASWGGENGEASGGLLLPSTGTDQKAKLVEAHKKLGLSVCFCQ
jgi:hypothetical protein